MRSLDPVARFHLGNGAALERLNWMGDTSQAGMARSAGLMVNYVYRLNEVERNHERYFSSHAIAASPQVEKLARECLFAAPATRRRGGLSVQGRLPENVMHFARLLRAAGLRVGSDRVIDCVRALEIAGRAPVPPRRDDWYWTMSAVLLSRQEQRPIFDQAFRIFWRDPKLAERMMSLLLPHAHGRAPKPEQQQSQRLTDALFSQKPESQEAKA